MKLKPSLLAEVTTATRSPEMFTLELEERNNSSARNRKTVNEHKREPLVHDEAFFRNPVYSSTK